MDSPPPLKKINILWSKFVTAPPKNNISVLHCNRPPLAGTSRRVQWVQTGLGLGVQGQAELGLGGQECWEGECGKF